MPKEIFDQARHAAEHDGEQARRSVRRLRPVDAGAAAQRRSEIGLQPLAARAPRGSIGSAAAVRTQEPRAL